MILHFPADMHLYDQIFRFENGLSRGNIRGFKNLNMIIFGIFDSVYMAVRDRVFLIFWF